MYKLIIQDDEGKTTVVPLIREELTIGRQDGNTIRLTERNVSRRHAKLLRGQEAIMIEDLDSYNGVRVNGTRIQGKVSIKEADRVQIGDYLIEVKAEQVATTASEQRTMEFRQVEVPVAVPVGSSGAETVPTPAAQTAEGSGDIDVAAIAAVAAQPEEVFPRMVVLSTSMAGREFSLSKPSMVIGRTEDNDLWINHRSVSQHHAKIVREGDSFTIVDLESSNGVRVNGEDYGKVELRRGDLVDLGHVRMRFVGADENFVFGRDAHAIDIGEGGKGKAIWLLLLLLLVGIGAFVMFGRDDKDNDSVADPQTNEKVDAMAVVKNTELDAGVVAEAPIDAATQVENVTNDGLAEFLAKAVEARNQNDWAAMSSAAKSAIEIDSSNLKAQEYKSQAEFETGNQDSFDKFQLAVGKQQIAKVALYFAAIDEASVYKLKARPDHVRVKKNYRAVQMKYAIKQGKNSNCAGIQQQAAQIPDEWPDIRNAIADVKCKSSVANNNNKRPDKPDKPDKPDNTVPDLSPAAVAQLLVDSKAAVRNKQFGKGLRDCQAVLKVSPGNQDALSTCAVAACYLQRSQTALRFARRLKGRPKASVQQICTRLKVAGFGDE